VVLVFCGLRSSACRAHAYFNVVRMESPTSRGPSMAWQRSLALYSRSLYTASNNMRRDQNVNEAVM
jgi:hypothetical protein